MGFLRQPSGSSKERFYSQEVCFDTQKREMKASNSHLPLCSSNKTTATSTNAWYAYSFTFKFEKFFAVIRTTQHANDETTHKKKTWITIDQNWVLMLKRSVIFFSTTIGISGSNNAYKCACLSHCQSYRVCHHFRKSFFNKINKHGHKSRDQIIVQWIKYFGSL